MATANADAGDAVLKMLDRYGVLMLEDLITGRPDFNLAQLFLAIERLSRTNVIALRRIGLRYEICLTNAAWPLGFVPSIKSRLRRTITSLTYLTGYLESRGHGARVPTGLDRTERNRHKTRHHRVRHHNQCEARLPDGPAAYLERTPKAVLHA